MKNERRGFMLNTHLFSSALGEALVLLPFDPAHLQASRENVCWLFLMFVSV